MDEPQFDRKLIQHIPTQHTGFALVNGCQGLFTEEIFSRYDWALQRWHERGGFESGLDEQVVEVAITITELAADPATTRGAKAEKERREAFNAGYCYGVEFDASPAELDAAWALYQHRESMKRQGVTK